MTSGHGAVSYKFLILKSNIWNLLRGKVEKPLPSFCSFLVLKFKVSMTWIIRKIFVFLTSALSVSTFDFCVCRKIPYNAILSALRVYAWVYDTELLNRQIFKIATSRRMLRVLTSSPFFFSNEKIPSQQVETASIILKNVCIKRCLKCCRKKIFSLSD